MTYQYFVASRWRNKDTVTELVDKLRAKGKTVYSFFEAEAEYELKAREHNMSPEEFMEHFENIPDWQNSPMIKEIFDIDMDALKASENVILLLPAGKSAHIEIGAAYGMNKRCILIGEQKETESLYMIFDEFHDSIDAFVENVR